MRGAVCTREDNTAGLHRLQDLHRGPDGMGEVLARVVARHHVRQSRCRCRVLALEDRHTQF